MKYEFIKSTRKAVLYTVLIGVTILNGCGKNRGYDEAIKKKYASDVRDVCESQQEFKEIMVRDKETISELNKANKGLEELTKNVRENGISIPNAPNYPYK